MTTETTTVNPPPFYSLQILSHFNADEFNMYLRYAEYYKLTAATIDDTFCAVLQHMTDGAMSAFKDSKS